MSNKSLFDYPQGPFAPISYVPYLYFDSAYSRAQLPIFSPRFFTIVLIGYLSPIPVLNKWVIGPSDFASKYLTPILWSSLSRVTGVVSDGTSSRNSYLQAIALLTLFYIFIVYILTGLMSSTAQLIGNKAGYKNKGTFITGKTLFL